MFIYGFYISFFSMLVRKIRRIGSSLVVTIPSQLASFYDMKENDWVVFEKTVDDSITFKKKGSEKV